MWIVLLIIVMCFLNVTRIMTVSVIVLEITAKEAI